MVHSHFLVYLALEPLDQVRHVQQQRRPRFDCVVTVPLPLDLVHWRRLVDLAHDALALISRRVGPEQRRPWPPVLSMDEVLVIIQRVLRGVDYLARNGIVHRDIKADNILVDIRTPTRDGPPEILVKIADFGHALKPQDGQNLQEPYINEGLPKGGASAFLAPEIESAQPGTVTAPKSLNYSKNDVFAVGMMAHTVLTNCTGDVFCEHHPHYSAQTYNKLPDGCPQEIADFVWAMVNPSFDERITTTDALARVDALLRGPELHWG